MTNQTDYTADDEDEDDEARTARLLRLTAAQIVHYSYETILDWLDARNRWRCAQLRAACQTLREQSDIRQRAYARIAAALATEPDPARPAV